MHGFLLTSRTCGTLVSWSKVLRSTYTSLHCIPNFCNGRLGYDEGHCMGMELSNLLLNSPELMPPEAHISERVPCSRAKPSQRQLTSGLSVASPVSRFLENPWLYSIESSCDIWLSNACKPLQVMIASRRGCESCETRLSGRQALSRGKSWMAFFYWGTPFDYRSHPPWIQGRRWSDATCHIPIKDVPCQCMSLILSYHELHVADHFESRFPHSSEC